ncbi:hypothetical protein AX774_g7494 [Zancudomyces culisetae]|uniref:DUF1748-domain-containing protein n=1 Tax=Zancudomyces culisetae TaxID=1213189 RepID=A0A1R1PE00_ZANCU|nr:hypothetical protein AX774_g7494 [Zancudomyces culisetae]|eukprot:OMH79102.1 hypothetical protein AX774_g7494 [Zancudomyces culisetae]
MMGKLVHYAFDLALIAALLSGIRRTTGFTLKCAADNQSGNSDSLSKKYLRWGDYAFDFVVGIMTTFPNLFVRLPPGSGQGPNH